MKREYGEHSCPLPKATRDHEGFIYACTCGRLWVAREDWQDAVCPVRTTTWKRFTPIRRRWWQA